MKRNPIYCLIFLTITLLLPFVTAAQDNIQSRKDSLRKVITAGEGEDLLEAYRLLTFVYFPESAVDKLKMDTLLALYKAYDAEALHQKQFNTQGLIRFNIVSAHLNRNEYDEIFKLAPEYLSYLAGREVWNQYYAVRSILLLAHLRKGEIDKTIEGAQQMYEEARQRAHEDGKGRALYILSSAYSKMSRWAEEEQYLRETIEIIKNSNGMEGFAAQMYSRLCNLLIITGQYDEALRQAVEFEKMNYRYEEKSGSKQPTTWMNLWSFYTNLYARMGDYEQSETYCDKLDSMGCTPSIRCNVLKTRAEIYYHRKQYDKALEMVDKSMELCAGDANQALANMGVKLMILCSQKGVDDIHELFRQSLMLNDSIRNREMNARLDELRTIYEVDKITSEKERTRNYLLFTLAACVLLAFALGLLIYHSRTVVRKNRGLYRRIIEQDRLAEDLENERRKNLELQLLLHPDAAAGAPEENSENLTLFFGKLTLLMKEKRLFTDSNLKRKDVALQLGISDRGLHDCIKNATGLGFTEYLNTLRLAYSRELLSNKDVQLTIEAIALEAGFASRTTFYRLFYDNYGLSPKKFMDLV